MAEITESIHIDAAADKIFSFVSDYRNDVRWRQGVLAMRQVPDRGTAVGTETYETIKFMGRTMEVKARVVEFLPGIKVSFQSVSSPMRVKGYRMVGSLDNNRSSFTYSISSEMTGLYRLFSSGIEKMYRNRIRQDLHQLKVLMEQEKR